MHGIMPDGVDAGATTAALRWISKAGPLSRKAVPLLAISSRTIFHKYSASEGHGLENDAYRHRLCEHETLDGAIKIAVYHGAWYTHVFASLGQTSNHDTVSDADILVSVSSNGLLNQLARARRP
jgi:hypothetical protein